MPKTRTTKAVFNKFREACFRWQYKMLLGRWDLHVEWKSMPHQACAVCNYEGMVATIKLTKSSLDYDVERLAFHEVAEVYMWRMREIMEEHLDEDEVDRIVHECINNMENAVFGKKEGE